MRRLRVGKAHMPQIKDLLDQQKQQAAAKLLMKAEYDYFTQLTSFLSPLPVLDTALMIATLEHVAAEYRRLDPKSAILCDTVKRMSVFPPMKLRTVEKK